MKAMAFASYGPPDVLHLTDFPEPQPAAGQVRIAVKAAGVQPADVAVRRGWSPPGQSIALPQIPGNEFAGVIEKVGTDVGRWAVADEVLGFSTLNCYAERLVISAEQIVAKPTAMPWEVAGGFTAGAQTAHRGLEALDVRAGDTVLINAAAGAVGTVAVQLARLAGACVIGTASPANHDHLRSLGAIPVTYGDGMVARVRAVAPDGVDAALDAAGPDALYASVELVSDRSRVVTIVADGLGRKLGIGSIQGQRSAERLARLVTLWDEGKLTIVVRRSYPLAQAAAAHREVERGHGRGKVVLVV